MSGPLLWHIHLPEENVQFKLHVITVIYQAQKIGCVFYSLPTPSQDGFSPISLVLTTSPVKNLLLVSEESIIGCPLASTTTTSLTASPWSRCPCSTALQITWYWQLTKLFWDFTQTDWNWEHRCSCCSTNVDSIIWCGLVELYFSYHLSNETVT